MSDIKIKRLEETPTQEGWFLHWLEEAKEAGYIQGFQVKGDVIPFKLTDRIDVKIKYDRVLYKGTKRETIREEEKVTNILREHTYKADALIIWTKKAEGIFFEAYSEFAKTGKHKTFFTADVYPNPERKAYEYISYVEIKAPFGGKNSDQSFPINRKWVFDKYKVFVNKAVQYPNKVTKRPQDFLWLATFTPKRYLFTDKNLDKKKISMWNPRTLHDFILTKI
ncbi:MAG: hypothetical protein KAH25_12800 [Bacteroidales bacterium]|nr:hypothetical protein [Bacteroidales bacterium]